MNRKRILLVLIAMLVSTAFATGLYRHARGSAQGFPAADHSRKLKGVLPAIRSTVPGVVLKGELVAPQGHEFARLVIENDTDRAIDAYEIATGSWPSPTGATVTRDYIRSDARDPQRKSETFTTTPSVPLIAARGTKEVMAALSDVPDYGELTLTAIAFHDGDVAGRRAKEFKHDRAFEADRHGFPDELRAEKAHQGK